MKGTDETRLEVWLDDPDFGPLQHIGTLAKGNRGAVRFSYERTWLDEAQAFGLDPELDLSPGEFFPVNSNFGVFMDSCPDRWGQLLMRRREEYEAAEQDRRPRTLGPWEFLIGVQDVTRMGALRFRRPGGERFLSDEVLSAPPLTSMAELQESTLEMTKKTKPDGEQLRKWLQALVAPGSSLGGARPKANVMDERGGLWIAKFPSADDDYDVALWEKLLVNLARRCRITVPESKLMHIAGRHHIFMTKRFDRTESGRRFFASAMTMLHHTDSEDASYLELAEFIRSYGREKTLTGDLHELFRRVVFNIATANRDDHLRNHGFIRTTGGWELSPAYDLNPSFRKEEHVLSIDLYRRLPDLEAALATAEYYQLDRKSARESVDEVLSEVSAWESHAKNLGIDAEERAGARHLFLTR